ncbi:FAD-dependent oxidoreductase [Mesosutterella sp. AGMB02718]|uniref:FAD-dependent oxidoreductase n=1 Tax=Mesosutterella faecium TaxID=2925194 RepID=A0ABT7IMT2_9BURK|nr:FAD-dependent oxidoreductase [Mesosutterella sp. AGMB02718]MDL2059684.1 FAD-dependent oxidoreductase [Mesosutterella sp. AGMB02718]
MQNQSRRSFFKTAALSAVGAAALTSGAAEAAGKKAAKKAEGGRYDMIIVGAGCGGLVCAVRAAQIGLKPILLEKMGDSAGNTIYAAGFMLGTNTKMQKEAGISGDSADKFYDDMIKVSKGHGDPALTRYLVDNCDKTLEWMSDYCGVKFKAGMKLVFPMLTRAHLVVGPTQPGGSQLALYLQAKAKSLGVPMLFNTKVVKLLQNSKGVIDGVKVKTKTGYSEIHSRAGVILATGGYSANQAMVTMYAGSAAAKMPIRGSRIIAGENIVLTQPFMPKIVNVDQYHCGPIHGPTGANPLNIVNKGICVSKEKTERFTDEGQTYVQMSRDTAAMTKDNWAFMIVDDDVHNLKMLANDWNSYARNRAPVYKADTIEELAKKAGLDPKKLVKIVKDYNAANDNNTRGKLVPPNTLPKAYPVKKAPFYAVPFQGGMTATFGGPLVNTNAQVLDTENQPIPGLFAIGNAAGGLFYDDYVGGAQLTNAAVYGYHVADYIKAQLKK